MNFSTDLICRDGVYHITACTVRRHVHIVRRIKKKLYISISIAVQSRDLGKLIPKMERIKNGINRRNQFKSHTKVCSIILNLSISPKVYIIQLKYLPVFEDTE